MVKFCAYCRQHPEKVADYDAPGYCCTYKDHIRQCAICNNELIDLSMTFDEYMTLIRLKSPIELFDAMVELKDKDIIEFETKMAQFRASAAQIKAAEAEAKKPKCSRCGSTNIQIVPRKWSLFAGFATNKTDRVCANCKHKW